MSNHIRSDGEPLSISRILTLALWFGLVTGYAETTVVAIQKFLLGRVIFMSPQFVWFTPVANLLYVAVLALGLCLIAAPWPRRITLHRATLAFASLGFLCVLLLYGALHRLAAIVLAVGLAVQTARLVGARPAAFLALTHRTTRWMVLLLATVIVAVPAWNGIRERQGEPVLAGVSRKPNVLLIVLDTVRAQNLSLYGYQRSTSPVLDQFARRGARFEWAIVTAPWTTPSHGSMFTGYSAFETSTDRKKPMNAFYPVMTANVPTLAEVLQANGYRTGGFVANIDYCGHETGLSRGFAHYEANPVSLPEILLTSALGRTIKNSNQLQPLINSYDIPGRKSAAMVNRRFLQWLSRSDDRPFFAFLNYYDAHEPYLPPEPFDVRFGSAAVRKNSLIRHWSVHLAKRHDKDVMSTEQIQGEIDAYDGGIAYMDQQLGSLFGQLASRGVLDNTLVIVTSDHGEHFGEHGYFGHNKTLYMQLLHVPLLVVLPGSVPAGVNVPEPVSLRDLPATVLDLIELNDAAAFPGHSLAAHWDPSRGSTARESRPVLSEITFRTRGADPKSPYGGYAKSLIAGGYHYILNGNGKEELYDFENDAAEAQNLAHDETNATIVARFRTQLATTIAGRQRVGTRTAQP